MKSLAESEETGTIAPGEGTRVPLKIVCAWCHPPQPGERFGLLSHGICARHFKEVVLEVAAQAMQNLSPSEQSLGA